MALDPRNSPYLDPEVIKFIENFNKIILKEALQDGTDREKKVLEFQQPEHLEKLLELDIGYEPETTSKMLDYCRRIIRYSVKTGHPHFFNQLYGAAEPYSVVGSWLTDTLNTNLHTYEASPAFVVMENYVMAKACQKVGFPDGEGVMCPGGSFANLMAIHVARYRNNPDVAKKGLWDMPKLRLYTSTDGHYSLKKSGLFMGFGTDNVIAIPTDDKGSLRADAFITQIEKDKAAGYVPLFVMATCGSTVIGSFDNLNEVADVCKKYGLWMHVDAAWGGGCLLSDKHKHLMKGVERVDSLAWNLHKMSHVNIQASLLLVKEKGLLQKANGVNAEYLFQPDKPYDTSYDIGDRSIQCGRKVDVVKVWMTWKGLGDKGMGETVDRAYDNARYFTHKLKQAEGFRLVLPEFQCTNICFWYIPPSLRGQKETREWWAKIAKVAPAIKKKMMTEGTMMIAYQPLSHKNLVNFFRIIISNPVCGYSDMDFAISEIQRLGQDIDADQL